MSDPNQPPHGPPWQGTPPPQGPPPRAGTNKTLVVGIVVAVLVLIAGGVVGLVLALGGDDDGDGGGGDGGSDEQAAAEEVAVDFLNASAEGDCDRTESLVTEDLAEEPCETPEESGGRLEVGEIQSTEMNGDEAVVEIEATVTEWNSEPATGTVLVELVMEDGEWKVADLQEGSTDEEDASPEATPDTPDTDSTAGDDPKEVVEDLVEAASTNDCEAAKELAKDESVIDCADLQADDRASVTFGEVTELGSAGPTKVYQVELVRDGRDTGYQVMLRVEQVDDGWVVAHYDLPS